MIVDGASGGFHRGASRCVVVRETVEDVDDVVMRQLQLGLREERQQVFISAVSVHDDNLFAAVAAHLIGGLL